MDSRQRVERALSHAEPDRVPIDYWPSVLECCGQHGGRLFREFHLDWRGDGYTRLLQNRSLHRLGL